MFRKTQSLLATAALTTVLLGCVPGRLDAQEENRSLPDAANAVSLIIKRGDLARLGRLIDRPQITFDGNGNIDEGIRCFLNWDSRCPGKRNNINQILEGDHFHFYYHIDERTVVVSYIRTDSRTLFNEDPVAFLQGRYLEDYFSCQFILVGGEWLLQESVCFSETEGPFSLEPEV